MPPRGSAQDEVLREVLRREKSEKFAVVELFANLIGNALGVERPRIESMIEFYLLELSQDRYRPSVVAALRGVRKARKVKVQQDQALLAKLDKFTVPDEDLPPPPKAKGRGRRR